jgi:iron(III) transport system substrate-binding protein
MPPAQNRGRATGSRNRQGRDIFLLLAAALRQSLREDRMPRNLATLALAVALTTFGTIGTAFAQAPAPTPTTPELIEAAKKEGKVIWYTSAELSVIAAITKSFEAKYPGITVQVERSGAERNFQRISQEYSAGIHNVDLVDSSDSTLLVLWKRQGLLAPYVPEDVAKYIPTEFKDADGTYAMWRATLSIMGFNTKLVKPEDAPQSFAEILDPKWDGKIVKAHPGYSGTILTATYEIVHDLGWRILEKLGKLHVLQVQSASDPPRQLSAGERPLMFDGIEYLFLLEQQRGSPIQPIYPKEGTPFVPGALGVMKAAPHPSAARLYENFLFSQETQQLCVDVGGLRSLHAQVKERQGRIPLKDIKLLHFDSEGILEHAEEIKQKYAEYFGI